MDNAPSDPADRYQGFSLQDVTWGYRAIFEETIEALFQDGHIGHRNPQSTLVFFEFLNHCNQPGADHVIHAFLKSLAPQTKWITGLPKIFELLLGIGRTLTEHKISAGLRFFEQVGAGALGATPDQARHGLQTMRFLFGIDPDLSIAFLSGYQNLSERMTPDEINRYLDVALKIHQNNHDTSYAFLRGELSTSETYIRTITQECCLSDITDSLRALAHALCDQDFEIDQLGQLDSDDLILRGSQMVQIGTHLYLPARIRTFGSRQNNRTHYTLCTITAAAMWQEKSFPVLHGRPGIQNASALCGPGQLQQNLFLLLEYTRVLRRIYHRWPGTRVLLSHTLKTNLAQRHKRAPEHLIQRLLTDIPPQQQKLIDRLDRCVTCFETAELLPSAETLLSTFPNLDSYQIPPFDFLPDFFFPGNLSDPPPAQWVADHDKQSQKNSGDPSEEEDGPDVSAACDETGEPSEETLDQTVIEFAYNEWDFQQSDYRPDWCHIHQIRPDTTHSTRSVPAEWKSLADRVRRVFERLKPELVRREKYLADGDTINTERLVEYMVDRQHETAPPVRLYEKPLLQHRDPAVLILLDLSGSTAAETADKVKVLDLEKQAGVILGEGLNALDDRFAVCGFNSSGREQCRYLVFKDSENNWSADTIARLMTTHSQNSTRIGPAIRHSIHLLTDQPTQQKLILLITDGKPMDNGYDPVTRYAQHDVRMACEEARRCGIHTFAISTEENSAEDMDLMFPNHRYVLLPDISRLPTVLPRLYMHITK